MSPLILDQLSVCSVPLIGWSGKNEIGIATGFFWRQSSRIFLVSNWHVYSGRAPKDGQPIHEIGGLIPDRVETHCPMRDPGTSGRVRPKRFTAQLWRRSASGQILARWLQHPIHGSEIDVAVLEIGCALQRNELKYAQCINDISHADEMIPSVGPDVFVIGYPLRPESSGPFPIWKRGSIATEYDIPHRHLEAFLVDSTTKDGMSGSPVILRAQIYNSSKGTTNFNVGMQTRFLGVYSGRELGTNNSDTQLGIVWKSKYIPEIIVGNVGGVDLNFGVLGIDIDFVYE